MANPVVAIVGRPNVGKSTFFNYITGRRISIVEDTPGVTRDRVYAKVEWLGKEITVIDTGGIDPEAEDDLMKQMKNQAEIAINTADVIIFLVDMRQGITPSDIGVAQILRISKKPIVVAVNKADRIGEVSNDVFEFYNLGLGDVFPISSTNALGIGDLLDEVFKKISINAWENEEDNSIKVAIIGKPNSGKSSLVNTILGENRIIVSDIPGTTRDAIDTPVEKNGNKYVFIDTAGIRRKSRIKEDIEKYSVIRSWAAVDRSDVCVLMIDAVDFITEQDTKIVGYALEQGKAIIIAINKWDLVDKKTGTFEKYKKNVYEKLAFLTFAPVIFISAKTGQRINQLFENIDKVFANASFRITTGMLNDVLNDAVAMVQPPTDKGKRLKIFYMLQGSVRPPTFILFINKTKLMHFSYQRYLENQLREYFDFSGTPVRFILREREKKQF